MNPEKQSSLVENMRDATSTEASPIRRIRKFDDTAPGGLPFARDTVTRTRKVGWIQQLTTGHFPRNKASFFLFTF